MPKTKNIDNSQVNQEDEDLSKKYEKKTHLQHIKDLPETYIGSIQKEKSVQWIVEHLSQSNNLNGSNNIEQNSEDNNTLSGDNGDNVENDENQVYENILIPDANILKKIKIINKEIEYPPGLMNIIEEILVNAFDNRNRVRQRTENGQKRLKKVSHIKVTVNQETGTISIENDGEGIDIAEHPTEKIYIPQMIFGELLTSGNYNKNEEKITGGKNGYGAKLTNIFSKYFKVETVDRKRKLYFCQEYRDNMDIKGKPKVEKYTKDPFTRITFTPDYARFGIDGLYDSLISLIEKRTYDMVACSSGELDVYFNGQKVDLPDFNTYMSLYIGSSHLVKRVTQKVNDRWEIGASITPSFNFQHVSFVNGINTNRGGRHVDYIAKQISKGVVDYIKKKKKIDVKEHVVKDNMMIFVNSVIVNPSFDSQTKETLTTPKSKFGSECEVPAKFIENLAQSGLMDRAIALSEFRDKQLLTKTDGKKQKRILDVEKLDDARLAGTKNAAKCTLILTEGDSAKAMAVAGISVIPNGRDIYGIFPLRGKLLNTRDKKEKDVAKNQEITDIKKILALQEGKNYKNASELRYGRIMIMTDQDVDGSHIKGLIMNFLSKWPSLMQIKGFITSLLTPIVKVKRGKKQVINFYTLSDYHKWLSLNNDGRGWTSKYYKGLGTSTPAEAKEYFKDFKIVEYNWSELCDTTIDLAFNKERADDRKVWLADYDCDRILNLEQTSVSYSDFINKELIHFSNADNERSIPSLCDGLKPSQRKILYCCNKRNLRNEIRVAQLAGYVSEHGAYHHGEASLHGTIVGMAQNFTGASNINILEPVGQFGSRLKGGKDSAQPRYIHTHLTTLSDYLFKKVDNNIYNYTEDDGLQVEPEFYMPVIPMVLLNGTEGIGTGWSCNIPQFHPKDVIDNIRNLMNGKEVVEMTPWYRGFCGKIDKIGSNQWVTKGKYILKGSDTVIVTELPVGVWTDNYRILLDELMQGPNIDKKKDKKDMKGRTKVSVAGSNGKKENSKPLLKDYINHSTESTVNFTLKFDSGILSNLMTQKNKQGYTKLETTFNLISKISCDSRLNLYNEEGKLVTFKSPESILRNYYKVRKEWYQKRKDYIVDRLEQDTLLISIKVKFILDVIDKKILINNQAKSKIIEQLEKAEFPKMFNGKLYKSDGLKSLKSKDREAANYDFLIKMPLYNLTKERIEELKKECDTLTAELESIKKKTDLMIWEEDLKEFEKHYEVFMKEYYTYMGFDSSIYKERRKKVKPVSLRVR